DLEVQVGSGGVTGVADPPDHRAGLHHVAGGDQDLRLVGVAGGQLPPVVRAVAQAREVAVAAVPAGLHDDTVGGGADRCASRCAEVRPGVHEVLPGDRVHPHAVPAGQDAVDRHEQGEVGR